MKKVMIFAATILTAVYAQAQEIIFDGLSWSGNDYVGTARTLGMGNAVTAVGGDPGSFAINPAGGAVNAYSQLVLTPGGSIGITSTQWNRKGSFKESNGRFSFPNGGISFNFNTGNSSGLVRCSFGFVANATNIYNSAFSAGGNNDKSSFASYLAGYADGQHLAENDLLDYNADYCCSAAYNSFVIDCMDGQYIGTTENTDENGNIVLAGPVNQYDCRRNGGIKMDYVFNFGFDISNVLFIGANIGITNLNYTLDDGLCEKATDYSRGLFETGFKELNYSYSYRAVGSGVYGKLGVIATPFDGLRLGAAIQTPTNLKISESVQHSMTHSYDYGGKKYGDAISPQSIWDYKVISPMRFNLGVAYTIANCALVSLDYERADYGSMRFRENDVIDRSYFEGLNKTIRGMDDERYSLHASNMLRAGIEIKPVPELAVRAGYNFATSGRMFGENTHAATFGLGYISKGSFYCDAAAKLSFMPTENILVYDGGPSMTSSRRLLNIIGTLGWRF